MKILALSDEELMAFWDCYVPGRLKEYDLILSAGDLKAAYLSFIVTMARAPLMYVHGNHDTGYAVTEPEGCDCIDGAIVEYGGLRILGLGGCVWYRPGAHQYTEKEMRKRIRKLRWQIAKYGGVDIVVTHAPVDGFGDGEDNAHKGFECFRDLIDTYHPRFLLHGHVHLSYGMDQTRVREYNGTKLINVCEKIHPGHPQGGHRELEEAESHRKDPVFPELGVSSEELGVYARKQLLTPNFSLLTSKKFLTFLKFLLE